MTLQEKREQMFIMVEHWQKSGISQLKYVKKQGLHINKFRYWVRMYKQKNNDIQEPAFIALPNLSPQAISIKYPNGIEVKLPSHFSAEYLRTLIHV